MLRAMAAVLALCAEMLLRSSGRGLMGLDEGQQGGSSVADRPPRLML